MNKDLTVLIPTYNRPSILYETIRLLRKNLRYSLGETYYLIGNDGDTPIPTAIEGADDVTVIPGPRNGLGGNLNSLIMSSRTSLLFQMDDDHHLLLPLDLDDHVAHLLDDTDMGWIRLMFGRCTGHEGYYHFSGRLRGKYWRLVPNEGEFYLTSNRPHLKVKEFHTEGYGLYTDGLKLGETEYDFCSHFNKTYREGETPSVYMPMYPPPEETWDHVGESYQHTEHDK